MKKYILIILTVFLLQGCQLTLNEKKIDEITNKTFLDTVTNDTLCVNTFEDLNGNRINLQKIVYSNMVFYEVYTCKSPKDKSQYIYLNRYNPHFVTQEIKVIENGKIIKPYYNYDNIGNINISFEVQKNSTIKIMIKNFIADVTYMSLN